MHLEWRCAPQGRHTEDLIAAEKHSLVLFNMLCEFESLDVLVQKETQQDRKTLRSSAWDEHAAYPKEVLHEMCEALPTP